MVMIWASAEDMDSKAAVGVSVIVTVIGEILVGMVLVTLAIPLSLTIAT